MLPINLLNFTTGVFVKIIRPLQCSSCQHILRLNFAIQYFVIVNAGADSKPHVAPETGASSHSINNSTTGRASEVDRHAYAGSSTMRLINAPQIWSINDSAALPLPLLLNATPRRD